MATLFLCFFLFFYSNSQNIEIIYGIELKDDLEIHGDNTMDSSMRSSLYNQIKKMKFSLKTKGNISSFQVIETMTTDSENFESRMAKIVVRGNNIFYSDLNKKIVYETEEFLDNEYVTSSNLGPDTWVITTETKKIDDYQVIKATSVKEGIDKYRKKTYTPITVWFTPQYPFSFGPYESSGLPGLVLQYELGHFIWKYKNIKITNRDIDVKIPVFKKIITRDSLNEIIRKKHPF